jgi:hypothetical protein
MRLLAQWHLRTTMLAIAVLAVVLALVFEPRQRLATQERAIAAVEKLDGSIGARPGFCVVNSTRRPVVSITLNNSDVTDSDLVVFTLLPELETLGRVCPSLTEVTEVAVKELRQAMPKTEVRWLAK